MNKIYQNSLLYPDILWERPVHYYKSQAGKVLVIAGSKGMSGAAILTCESVFRSGTGILVLGFPEKIKEFYSEILPESMTLPLPSTYGGSLSSKSKDSIIDESKSCNAVIIGPGISKNSETIHLVWSLIFEIDIPIILDADGLYALAAGISVIRNKEDEIFLKNYFLKLKAPLIITPHPGEAQKILEAISFTDKKVKHNNVYIEKHKEEIAPILSDILNCYTVLKGYDTLLTDPDGRVIVNKIGGPELATAGSGDVLSGIIGSFIAQNPNKIFESIATAVYLHGLSGTIAKRHLSDRSVMASDIIKYLPEAIKDSEKHTGHISKE